MNIIISFDDKGIPAQLNAMPQRLAWHLEAKLHRFAQEIARDMKAKAPKAFSTLSNSVKVDADGPLAYKIGPHVAYAWAVEYGRKPGGKMPPIQSLIDWIKVKHIQPFNPQMDERDLAFLMGRMMQKRGIKAQPFVTPFARDVLVRQRGDDLLRQAVDDWLAEIG